MKVIIYRLFYLHAIAAAMPAASRELVMPGEASGHHCRHILSAHHAIGIRAPRHEYIFAQMVDDAQYIISNKQARYRDALKPPSARRPAGNYRCGGFDANTCAFDATAA